MVDLRLRTTGLSRAIYNAFADGKVHTMDELVDTVGSMISPELAVRRYQQSSNGDIDDIPLSYKIETGRRWTLSSALRDLGAEACGVGGKKYRWHAFRILPRTYGYERQERAIKQRPRDDASRKKYQRLSVHIVAQIKRLYDEQQQDGSFTTKIRFFDDVRERFLLGNTHESTIDAIITGKNWGHVDWRSILSRVPISDRDDVFLKKVFGEVKIRLGDRRTTWVRKSTMSTSSRK